MKTLLMSVIFACTSFDAKPLTIIREFIGGTPPTNSVGQGNLTNIIDQACKVWELAIRDEFVLTLRFGWSAVGGGQHVLNAQGGTPNRETRGTILFNNDNIVGHTAWFLDPDPLNTFSMEYIEQDADLGVGPINATRYFTWPYVGNESDLFTAALHEIGHALGLSFGNTSFNVEIVDRDIDITSGSFSGMTVLMQTNRLGVVSHIDYVADRPLMTGSFASGERVMPSVLDIAILAELSKFKNVNFDLVPALHISAPYKVGNVSTCDLSWIEPIRLSSGMHYKVQRCFDLQRAEWMTMSTEIILNNGAHVATVTLSESSSFFRLKAEPQ